MNGRFLYVYFMRDDPDQVREVAPEHARYWRDLDLPGYLGGPFAGLGGGAISFVAPAFREAEQLVAGDPFVVADLLVDGWLKEWHVE